MTELLLKDEVLWNRYVEINKNDKYSARCVSFAHDWAIGMQSHIPPGAEAKQITQLIALNAEAEASKADYDGITGFMYSAAVTMLSQCWLYGEDLRRWHNKEVQIGDEGDRMKEEVYQSLCSSFQVMMDAYLLLESFENKDSKPRSTLLLQNCLESVSLHGRLIFALGENQIARLRLKAAVLPPGDKLSSVRNKKRRKPPKH